MFKFSKYKNIKHPNGTIQFRVLKEWKEETEDDGNLVFWNEKGLSGTLRVTVITAKKENNASVNPAIDFLGSREPTPLELSNGNAYRHYEEAPEEDGENLIIYYFELGNFIEPNYYRMAIFSFSILSEQKNEKEIQDQLKFLQQELPKTIFSSKVQEWEQ